MQCASAGRRRRATLAYEQIWRHPWNRKYITYHYAAIEPPTAIGNTHKNLVKIGRVFRRYDRGQTNTHRDRHAHHNTPRSLSGAGATVLGSRCIDDAHCFCNRRQEWQRLRTAYWTNWETSYRTNPVGRIVNSLYKATRRHWYRGTIHSLLAYFTRQRTTK